MANTPRPKLQQMRWGGLSHLTTWPRLTTQVTWSHIHCWREQTMMSVRVVWKWLWLRERSLDFLTDWSQSQSTTHLTLKIGRLSRHSLCHGSKCQLIRFCVRMSHTEMLRKNVGSSEETVLGIETSLHVASKEDWWSNRITGSWTAVLRLIGPWELASAESVIVTLARLKLSVYSRRWCEITFYTRLAQSI